MTHWPVTRPSSYKIVDPIPTLACSWLRSGLYSDARVWKCWQDVFIWLFPELNVPVLLNGVSYFGPLSTARIDHIRLSKFVVEWRRLIWATTLSCQSRGCFRTSWQISSSTAKRWKERASAGCTSSNRWRSTLTLGEHSTRRTFHFIVIH